MAQSSTLQYVISDIYMKVPVIQSFLKEEKEMYSKWTQS